MTPDAVARLMLEHAGPLHGRILVLDDVQGALTRTLLDAGADVSAHCDDLRDAEALPPAARLEVLDEAAVAAADLALLRLPKSLGALEDRCQTLTGGGPRLRAVAGGRVKHMTTSQNAVLARHFADVRATLGRYKSRVLLASGPLGTPPSWPRSRIDERLGLTVCSFGSTFNTVHLDAGTALLADALAAAGLLGQHAAGVTALDLGSGSGILATLLARAGWTVMASDVSAAAVASTLLTAAANDVAVTAVQRDGLSGTPEASLDLVVTNPPFHRGAAKDSTPTFDMISAARRVLRRDGEFWAVFNSHLPYLAALRAEVGPTVVAARDRQFTVTRSRRR